MFPSIDIHKNCIGFFGRTITQKEPKYKISTGYKKKLNIFGLYQGIQTIIEKDYVIVVEGIFDVVKAHCSGFKNVVAGPGKSLSDNQISLLRRYCKNVILLFDNDSIGIAATKYHIEKFKLFDFFVSVGKIPQQYKDIDEFLNHNNDAITYLTKMFHKLSNT
jgi:DNA primase